MKEALARALASSDPEERRRAAARIGEETEGGVSLLLAALGDDDWRVRKEAVSVATHLAPRAEVLSALVATLGPGDNVGLRNAAVEALGAYGADAVRALGAYVDQLDADGRKLAAEALAKTAQPVALGVLKRLLDDSDVNVQTAAIEAIAGIGTTCLEQAVPLLQQRLTAENQLLRLAAMSGLNQLGIVLPWESVEALMGDPILERTALTAAGRTASRKAVPALVQALEERRGATFASALASLVELIRSGTHTHDAVRQALASLSSTTLDRLHALAAGETSEPELARNALIVLALGGSQRAAEIAADALGDVAVAATAEYALTLLSTLAGPALIARISVGSPETRAEAIELLGRLSIEIEPEALESAVARALADPHVEVVRAALGTLAIIGGPVSLEAIATLLEPRAVPLLRKAGAAALAAIAERHPQAARALVARTGPGDIGVLAAVVITGALGGNARDSASDDLEFLVQALSNDHAVVRSAAIDAIAALGVPQGVDPVAFALTDETREVQLAAVHALGIMKSADGTAVGVGHLLGLVQRSDDLGLVVAAIRALGEARDPHSLSVLRPLVRSGDAMRAVAAVEAIAKTHDSRRTDSLIDALSHSDAEVVKAALRGLAEEVDPRVHAHLGACLDHEAWDVRRIAADLLGRSGSDTDIELLRAKLAAENEPLVREAIGRALAELEAAAGVRRSPPPSRHGSWRPR